MKKLCLLLLLFSFCFTCWAGVDFDGTDDQIDTVDINALDGASGITVACWMKWGGASGGWTTDRKLSRKGSTYTLFGGSTNSKVNFGIKDSGASWHFSGDSTTSVDDNAWYHIAGVYDGSHMRIYVNGNDENNSNEGAFVTESNANSVPVGSADGSDYFNGEITEFAIWDTGLSAAQLSLLANSKVKRMPLQIEPANIQIYLPMDAEESGTSADGDTFLYLSENGNNGTGDDGAGNTGLTATGEEILSYPPKPYVWE